MQRIDTKFEASTYIIHRNQLPIVSLTYNTRRSEIVTCDARTLRAWSHRSAQPKCLAELTLPLAEMSATSVFYSHRDNLYLLVLQGLKVMLVSAGLQLVCAHATEQVSILASAFSPKWQLLVTTGGDGSIKLFGTERFRRNTANGWQGNFRLQQTRVIASEFRWMRLLCLAEDDGRIFAAHESSILAWDMRTGQQLVKLHDLHPSLIVSCAFLPRDRQLLTSSYDGVVKRWSMTASINEGRPTLIEALPCHTSTVRALTSDAPSRLFFSCSDDLAVKLWNAESGALLDAHTPAAFLASSLATSCPPPSQLLYVDGSVDGSHNECGLLLVVTGALVSVLRVADPLVKLATLSADATRAQVVRHGAEGGALPPEERLVYALSANSTLQLMRLTDGLLRSIALPTGARDRGRARDEPPSAAAARPPSEARARPSVSRFVVSPAMGCVVVSFDDGTIDLVEAAPGGRCVQTLADAENAEPITALALVRAPAGWVCTRRAVAASSGAPAEPSAERPPPGAGRVAQPLRAWCVVSGSASGNISLWSAAQPDVSRTLRAHASELLVLLPFVLVRAQSDDGAASLGVRLVGERDGPSERGARPQLEEAQALLSVARDGVVRLWDMRELQCAPLGEFRASSAAIASALLRDDGGVLLGAESGTLELWSLRLDALELACDAAAGGCTAAPPISVGALGPLARPSRRIELHTERVSSLERAGGRFLSASLDGSVVLWHLATCTALKILTFGAPVAHALFCDDDGSALALVGDGLILVSRERLARARDAQPMHDAEAEELAAEELARTGAELARAAEEDSSRRGSPSVRRRALLRATRATPGAIAQPSAAAGAAAVELDPSVDDGFAASASAMRADSADRLAAAAAELELERARAAALRGLASGCDQTLIDLIGASRAQAAHAQGARFDAAGLPSAAALAHPVAVEPLVTAALMSGAVAPRQLARAPQPALRRRNMLIKPPREEVQLAAGAHQRLGSAQARALPRLFSSQPAPTAAQGRPPPERRPPPEAGPTDAAATAPAPDTACERTAPSTDLAPTPSRPADAPRAAAPTAAEVDAAALTPTPSASAAALAATEAACAASEAAAIAAARVATVAADAAAAADGDRAAAVTAALRAARDAPPADGEHRELADRTLLSSIADDLSADRRADPTTADAASAAASRGAFEIYLASTRSSAMGGAPSTPVVDVADHTVPASSGLLASRTGIGAYAGLCASAHAALLVKPSTAPVPSRGAATRLRPIEGSGITSPGGASRPPAAVFAAHAAHAARARSQTPVSRAHIAPHIVDLAFGEPWPLEALSRSQTTTSPSAAASDARMAASPRLLRASASVAGLRAPASKAETVVRSTNADETGAKSARAADDVDAAPFVDLPLLSAALAPASGDRIRLMGNDWCAALQNGDELRFSVALYGSEQARAMAIAAADADAAGLPLAKPRLVLGVAPRVREVERRLDFARRSDRAVLRPWSSRERTPVPMPSEARPSGRLPSPLHVPSVDADVRRRELGEGEDARRQGDLAAAAALGALEASFVRNGAPAAALGQSGGEGSGSRSEDAVLEAAALAAAAARARPQDSPDDALWGRRVDVSARSNEAGDDALATAQTDALSRGAAQSERDTLRRERDGQRGGEEGSGLRSEDAVAVEAALAAAAARARQDSRDDALWGRYADMSACSSEAADDALASAAQTDALSRGAAQSERDSLLSAMLIGAQPPPPRIAPPLARPRHDTIVCAPSTHDVGATSAFDDAAWRASEPPPAILMHEELEPIADERDHAAEADRLETAELLAVGESTVPSLWSSWEDGKVLYDFEEDSDFDLDELDFATMPQSAFDALNEYVRLKHLHALSASVPDASRDAALARLQQLTLRAAEAVEAARRARARDIVVDGPSLADTAMPAPATRGLEADLDRYRLQMERDIGLIHDVSGAAIVSEHPTPRGSYRELVDSLEHRWAALDRPRTTTPTPTTTPARRQSLVEDGRWPSPMATRRSRGTSDSPQILPELLEMPQPIKYSLLPPELTSHAAWLVRARHESQRQADRAQQASARKPLLPPAALAARPRTSDGARPLPSFDELSLRPTT